MFLTQAGPTPQPNIPTVVAAAAVATAAAPVAREGAREARGPQNHAQTPINAKFNK